MLLYLVSYVLFSSLHHGGLDCPVLTVTLQPPPYGVEMPRVNLCAMLADSI